MAIDDESRGGRGAPPSRARWLGALLPVLMACAAPPSPQAPAAASSVGVPSEPTEVDIDITFVPDITGNDGFFERRSDGPPGAPATKPLRLSLHAGADGPSLLGWQLERVSLAHTSLRLDTRALCSPELLAAATAQRPERLFIALDEALTPAVVACLAALPTPRLYLAGCLYRAHRQNTCDGDGDLAALIASPDAGLAARIAGLALSIRDPASLAALARLPRLGHLALATGKGGEARALFHGLPFDELRALTSLELPVVLEGEGGVYLPSALAFIARLRALTWNGELGRPLPTPCHLERVFDTRLNEDDAAGLAACGALQEIVTLDASFASAEPLRRWPALTTLATRGWSATDLSPLATLTRLRHLSLEAGAATDFSVLARLPWLRSLDVSQSALASLDVLADLTSLERLDLGFTAVHDCAPLAGLTALTDLDLHDTQVADVTALASLRALETLSLAKTAVRDLRPLTGLPKLARVVLYDSQVDDVSALDTLPALASVVITGLSLPPTQIVALKRRLGIGNVY